MPNPGANIGWMVCRIWIATEKIEVTTMKNRNTDRLDEFVLHAAMLDARRFVDGGVAAADAARRACNGALREYRDEVERRLRDEYAAV